MNSLCAGYAKLSRDCTCCAKYRHSILHDKLSQACWFMAWEILCTHSNHIHIALLYCLIPHCIHYIYLILVQKPICLKKTTQIWKGFQKGLFNCLLWAVLLCGCDLYLDGRIYPLVTCLASIITLNSMM